MIIDKEIITDSEYKAIYSFYRHFNDYMINYIIPEIIAFYLANKYIRKCLSNDFLEHHINSSKDIFNIKCNINDLIPLIEKNLRIKFNLKIANKNPLKLKCIDIY